MFKLLVVALFAAVVVGSNVLELTPENFDENVDGSKHVLVEFFAPWCGHCKNLAPEWERTADAFQKAPGVTIAKVDADAHKELGSRFGVSGYPTLLFFKKGVSASGEPEKYSGGRTAEDIVAWLEQETGARGNLPRERTAVLSLTGADFDDIVLDSDKDVLVEFYAPWCGHCKKLKPDYELLARAFEREDNVVIAAVDADAHKELGTRFGVTGFPTIKFFPRDNKEGETYEGGRAPSDFATFLNVRTGTFRNADGSLNGEAGRVDDLDDIADQFLDGDRAALRKEAETIAAGLDGADAASAKYYLKTMELIGKRGNGHPENEIARLTKMIASGSVTGAKVDQFTVRANILRSFLG